MNSTTLTIQIVLASILILRLFVSPVFAEQNQVSEIAVKGNLRYETSAIMNAIKVKPGDRFFEEKIDDDVRSIFALGYFSNVTVNRDDTAKGIVLTYTVTEKPLLREIVFDGNKAIGTDKIKEAAGLRANTIFSEKDLLKGIQRLKKLYADEGYSLSDVEPVKEKLPAGDIRLTLKIKEGDKILIREIVFEGNRAFSAKKLKSLMETKEDWWLSWLTGAGVYKDDVLKNDMLLLTEHYMNNGYINFRVGEPTIELTPDKKALQILITLNEGDKFRIGQIDFKGDLLETKNDLSKILKSKSGDVFSRGVLRQEIFALTDLYSDKGYAFANVTPLTSMHSAEKVIDLVFDFEKGDKVYINRINIAGNSKTRDKVIRREMRVYEGELYSATGIKRSKQNIMNLGYFEEATLATSKGKGDNRLNLDVNVKEKPTGTFSIGGGYSSLDGFVGQGSVQQANLFGYGLKSNLSASIGGKSSTYSLGITDPYFLDTKWSIGGDLYRTERQYVDYTKRSTGGDIKAGYQLSDAVNTFLLYKYEQTAIFDESFALKEIRRLNPDFVSAKNGTTSAIVASISRNTTDYRPDPSTGMTNSLSVEFAGLGGTNRYFRAIAQSSRFFPVAYGTVFMIHGAFGNIQPVGKDIPVDEKFYLGGINTLRGYSGRTVSPYIVSPVYDAVTGVKKGEQHAFIGGDTQIVFNAEYLIPLLKDAGMKGVIFFDIGNSVDGVGNVFSDMLSSYGFGIRWLSPIGPLRLEYGIPLNPRSGIDKSGKLEFSIGSFF